MKLFGRTGGHWLFWTGFCYLIGGLLIANSENKAYTLVVELVWIIAMSAPLWCPPFGRYLNMSVDWDRKMFNFFKKKEYSNVIEFPEVRAVPHVEPPEQEKDPTTYYTIGHTDDNRVSFRMGYSTLTMNYEGVQNLIDQLKLYQRQLAPKNNV